MIFQNDPPRPEPHCADTEGGSAGAHEQTDWQLAAALLAAWRQGGAYPRAAVMQRLAEMTAGGGAARAEQVALGLTDIAGTLLEICADHLKQSPEDVLRDVVSVISDDS